ncbi:MAG: hypothetical protein JXA13_06545 [Anaerolineales bacterium]|nr:hypothetical protein [Anaerolineales bacterium]
MFVLPVLLLFFAGWGGLALIVFYTLPTVWPRWAFFVFGLMALTGTALPAAYYLNKRFPSDPPSEPNVIVRQAVWVGVYGATLAWLQLGRVVNVYVIIGLAAGLLAVEYLIRMRERSRWRPPVRELPDDETDQD